MRRIGFVCFAVLLLWNAGAFAWGPATHAYLAMRITGLKDPDVILGAVAVDFSGMFRNNEKLSNALGGLTHSEFDRLEPSRFATGFATHNGKWGADYYAHLYYDKSAADIYSIVKIRTFSQEFGITMQQGEGILEGLVDYLVRLDYGPELGTLIKQAASGSTHEEELVKAFAAPAAERSGLSVEETEAEIRKGAQALQLITRMYGEQLEKQDEDFIRAQLPNALSLGVGCDMATAEKYVARAIELCENDYMKEMDRICAEVGKIIRTTPRCAEPCGLKPEAVVTEKP